MACLATCKACRLAKAHYSAAAHPYTHFIHPPTHQRAGHPPCASCQRGGPCPAGPAAPRCRPPPWQHASRTASPEPPAQQQWQTPATQQAQQHRAGVCGACSCCVVAGQQRQHVCNWVCSRPAWEEPRHPASQPGRQAGKAGRRAPPTHSLTWSMARGIMPGCSGEPIMVWVLPARDNT